MDNMWLKKVFMQRKPNKKSIKEVFDDFECNFISY